jgi:hypothetical protein
MKHNTEKNRERLVTEIIEGMDMDAVIETASSAIDAYLESLSNKEFTEEWEKMFDE